jgi:hypothetical protein
MLPTRGELRGGFGSRRLALQRWLRYATDVVLVTTPRDVVSSIDFGAAWPIQPLTAGTKLGGAS